MTALDELEKRLEGPGLIVALAKDEARVLLSAAREGEKDKARLRVAVEALRRMVEEADNAAWAVNTCIMDDAIANARTTLSRIDAALAPDHIGNSTTMVPALGVEGVAQIIRQHLNAPVSSCALLDIDKAASSIITAMGKQGGTTLGVAQIKATIWKHWRNQNGQTLEDRFTSAAEEIAAMGKQDG